MMQGKSSSRPSTLRQTLFGLTLLLVCLFASPSFAQISTAIHALWDSDLTDTTPGACATSGTVANPSFHFVAAYRYPVTSVTIDWARIEEQPEQHEPPQAQIQGGTLPLTGPPACGSLLVENPTQWMWGVSGQLTDPVKLHNTTYRVTGQYRYEVMDGPPYMGSRHTEGPFQTSITVNVQNLIVNSGDERKALKWDPARPEVCDTGFGYALSCAQRKQCQVTLRIYSTAGEKV